MRKLNPIQKFSLLSLVSVGILSVSTGLVASHLLTRSMLEREWSNTAGFVRAHPREHDLAGVFTDPLLRADRKAVQNIVGHLLTLPEVVRVKVFDRTGAILWSDEEKLIGRAFPDNPNLRAALRGTVTAVVKDLTHREHEYERPRFAKLAEIYVPIFGDGPGEVIGVIEVYKTPAILFANIRAAQATIWAVALLGGLILYGSLLFIVRRAYGTHLRLEADLRTHVDRLSLLYDLSAQLHASLSLEEILAAAMRQVVRTFGAQSAVVFLFDGAGQVSSRVGVWLSAAHEQGDFPRPHGLTRTILATGEPILIPDVARAPDRVHPAVLAEGVRAQIAIPLRSKGKVLGAFFAYYLEPHAFSPDEVETLVTYANQLAIAAENARLYEGIRRSAEELEARVAERTQQLQAVRAVSEEITQELALPILLELIVRRATELVGVRSGEVYLWDEAAQALVPQAWVGLGEWIREVRLKLGEGISGIVAQRREGMIVNDYRTWPAAVPAFLEDTGVTACLAEPLLYRDRLLGVITLDNQGTGHLFTEPDRELLGLFAAQAAIAIENARLYAEAQQRRAEAEALVEIGRAVGSSLELDKVLQIIADRTAEAMGAYDANLYLLDPGTGVLRIVAARGASEAFRHEYVLGPGEGVAGLALERLEPIWTADMLTDPRIHLSGGARAAAEDAGYRAVLAVPILLQEGRFGAVSIARRDVYDFAAHEVRFLEGVASQASVAIENARLFAATQRAAREARSLYEVAHSLATSLDLTEILRLIAMKTTDLLGTPHAQVVLWDEATQALRLAGAHGTEADKVLDQQFRLGEGVNGIVAQTRVPLIVNDYQAFPHRVPGLIEVVADIAVPLLYRGRLLGVLNSHATEPGATFTPEHLVLLTSLADQAAIAIENARLFAASEQRAAELSALREIGQAIASRLELPAVLEAVVAGAMQLLDTQHTQIILWDEASQSLRYGAALGAEAERVRTQTFAPGRGINGTVALTRQPMILNDYQASPYVVPECHDVVATITTPVQFGDRLLGVLHSHTTQPVKRFTPDDLRLLQMLATQAATAIENARLYEEIRQAAEQLEARVHERTAELEATNQELARANKAKSEFLANMSHELRTPLNAILGFSEVLHDQAFGPLNDRQRKYTAHIEAAGRHLLAIISDLLDLSRIEAGRLDVQPEPLDVAPAVAEALALVREAAKRKDIALDATGDGLATRVLADPVRLNQILYNLLSNAVKFTPAGGTVTVRAFQKAEGTKQKAAGNGQQAEDASVLPSADCFLPSGEKLPSADCFLPAVVIEVRDTGIGIAAEDLPRLFQEFVQLESPMVKRHAGAGLGLALTRRLVEMHGGTIAVTSPGKGLGTTFTVRLPAVAPASASEDRPRSQEVDA